MKSSGIGGQAVLEGVMMRNRDKCSKLGHRERTRQAYSASSADRPRCRGIYRIIDTWN